MLKIDIRPLEVEIRDSASGNLILQGPPLLAKVASCLQLAELKIARIVYHTERAEWEIIVEHVGWWHSLVFNDDMLRLVVDDSVIFDKMYQISNQVYSLWLQHVYTQYFGEHKTDDDAHTIIAGPDSNGQDRRNPPELGRAAPRTN